MRSLARLAYAAAVFAAMIAVCGSTAAAEFSAKDLAREEAKFAAYSVKNGMRAAFIEFFAEKSWLLRPEPVDAQAWIRGRPDPNIVLDWKSARTVMSASHDLGFSTGPSIYRSKTDAYAPAAHGEFFSVWQKQKSGEWKVLVDHGISHGPAATPDTLPTDPLIALDLPAVKSMSVSGVARQFASVRGAEIHFIAGNRTPYADAITPRTRLLREGQMPIDGIAAIGDYLQSQQGDWSWTVKLEGRSRANDMAYAVGNYTFQPKEGAAQKGQYVRVWVRAASDTDAPRWTLAAEVLTPEPVKK